MAESPPSTRQNNPQKVLIIETEKYTVAQHHVLQLNDEDNNKNIKKNKDTDEKADQKIQNPREKTRANIGEISEEEDQANRPLKKQKHRSLVSIYMATKPMNINC